MPNLLQDKASELRQRADTISQAIQLLDNSELDLAPEVNRVAISHASLPGIAQGTFCGHAVFGQSGQVVTVGVRRNGKDCVDLLMRREGTTMHVTERRYFEGHSVAFTVTAVYDQAGDLLFYEEIF